VFRTMTSQSGGGLDVSSNQTGSLKTRRLRSPAAREDPLAASTPAHIRPCQAGHGMLGPDPVAGRLRP
jgi:hypothetical protein